MFSSWPSRHITPYLADDYQCSRSLYSIYLSQVYARHLIQVLACIESYPLAFSPASASGRRHRLDGCADYFMHRLKLLLKFAVTFRNLLMVEVIQLKALL